MIKYIETVSPKLRFHSCGTVLFLCLILFGCKKPDDKLGLGIYPEDEQWGLLTTDTFTLSAKTVVVDSALSSNRSFLLLGNYNEKVFGNTSASVSLQYVPKSTNNDFGNLSNLVVDSVVISLVYADYYGTQGVQKISVFELDEDILTDSTYYSNKEFQVKQTNLVSQEIYKLNYQQKSIANGQTPEALRVNLSSSFGEELISQASISTDPATFKNEFKGLNINSEIYYQFSTSSTEGTGAIWMFDHSSEYSGLTVYYHNDTDTASFQFTFNDDEVTTVNHFSHDYSGTEVEEAISSESGDELLYIQGMSGVSIEFSVPHLNTLIKNGQVAINKAELIYTIEEGTFDEYLPESAYQLQVRTEAGGYTLSVDAFDSQQGALATINVDGEYRFLLTRDFQYLLDSYLEGNDYNFGYRIANSSPAQQTGRAILKGINAESGQVKLIVSYTPL